MSQRIGGSASAPPATVLTPGASSRSRSSARARERGPGGGWTILGSWSPSERHLVGVLDVAPDRHAERQAGHAQAARLEQPRQVEGRRFAFDVGIGGEHDLGDSLEPGEQAGDRQAVGSDPAMRRQRAEQHVIEAMVLAGALDGRDVEGLLDDADLAAVTLHVGAEAAGIDGGDGVAARAMEELLFHLHDGLGERLCLGGGDLEQVVGEAGGGLGTDPG